MPSIEEFAAISNIVKKKPIFITPELLYFLETAIMDDEQQPRFALRFLTGKDFHPPIGFASYSKRAEAYRGVAAKELRVALEYDHAVAHPWLIF